MKKIVVLNDFSIYPPNHGGKIRIYHIYKNISNSYKIVYICFGDSRKVEVVPLGDNFIEIRVPKGLLHKKWAGIINILAGVGVDDILAMFFCKYNKDLILALKEHLDDSDAIVSALPYMFPALERNGIDKPLIYDAQNVEYILKCSIFKGKLQKLLFANAVKKTEGNLIKAADTVFAPSATDIDQIMKIYRPSGDKLYISPNGTDISLYDTIYEGSKPLKEKVIDKPIAIFLGSAHPPNGEAACQIIEEISHKLKDVFFIIAGTVCWRLRDRSIPGNVGLAFEISDEEKVELFKISDVALNPMLSGSGTNIKMLDYMAAGLPVVATPVGARGLDIENYENAVICNISEFPDRIHKVINDRELYERLSRNGRRLVKEKYDWRSIAQNMRCVLEETVQRHSHRTTSE